MTNEQFQKEADGYSNTGHEVQIAFKFLNLRKSAIKRGLDFDLTLLSIRNLLSSRKCPYTGLPLSGSNFSVDRIDNTKGYIKGNVVACDECFNKLKGGLTPEQVKALYRLTFRGT